MVEVVSHKIPPDRSPDVASLSDKSLDVPKAHDDSNQISNELATKTVIGSRPDILATSTTVAVVEQSAKQGKHSESSAPPKLPSYKDLLLGAKSDFNGTSHASSSGSEDSLTSDLQSKSWKIPEPSEETKNLMNIYPSLEISEEEYNEACQPWNNSLIITVLGARFHLHRLKEMLCRVWKFTEFELVDLPNNYYVVRFTSPDNWSAQYRRIILEGPWVIAQHTVLVQKWSPYFDPFRNQLGKVATWVRIPNIPLIYYSQKFIERLGDLIGKTLKVDLHTLNVQDNSQGVVTRGRYARLCVKLDLQKRLVPRVILASIIFNVEYEGLDLICFSCGKYGHKKDHCSWGKKDSVSQEKENAVTESTKIVQVTASEKDSSEEEDAFGPWMLVGGQKNSRNPRKVNRRGGAAGGWYGFNSDRNMGMRSQNSRFKAISDMDDEGNLEQKNPFASRDGVLPVTRIENGKGSLNEKGRRNNDKVSIQPKGNLKAKLAQPTRQEFRIKEKGIVDNIGLNVCETKAQKDIHFEISSLIPQAHKAHALEADPSSPSVHLTAQPKKSQPKSRVHHVVVGSLTSPKSNAIIPLGQELKDSLSTISVDIEKDLSSPNKSHAGISTDAVPAQELNHESIPEHKDLAVPLVVSSVVPFEDSSLTDSLNLQTHEKALIPMTMATDPSNVPETPSAPSQVPHVLDTKPNVKGKANRNLREAKHKSRSGSGRIPPDK